MSNQDKTTQKAIDTIRLLASDAVEKAGSGHPGMPMGCADFAFTLWSKFLRFNPDEPNWLGRDRFVLSAGHGSMLLYSLLHLFEFDLPLEELKQFRQWQSKTPGHPEFGLTPGVEVTTGPLATGFTSAVGMAIAAKQFAARMENEQLFNQRIFALSSDGCMMEGVSHEAASLAGHNKLDNLIVFYDDNSITIEGSTKLAFSEDVGKRFEAYGWNVLSIDGQDTRQIEQALRQAIDHKGAPTLIIGKTTIGFGAPKKAGDNSSHGAPLGEEEIADTKAAFGFAPDQKFIVDDETRELCHQFVEEKKKQAESWNNEFEDFKRRNPEKADLMYQLIEKPVPDNLEEELLNVVSSSEDATRKTGGLALQRLAALMPAVTGGAADLAPSTNTLMKEEGDFCPADYSGRNLHFGVREFCMGLCANGMALFNTALPYTATFTVFADFMKPALRLAAIQQVNAVFVFTHDSIFVGEDGPTHQPIEQLAMLRSIPGMTVIRPAESHEVAEAWAQAVRINGPVALLLTRQKTENIPVELQDNVALNRGAYVLSDDEDFESIIMATGSELMPAQKAADLLREKGYKVRTVSMPSLELFEKQDAAYQQSILPESCDKRISVEAGSTFGWDKFTGRNGLKIGLDHFGHSGPADVLKEKYGLTPEALADRIADYLDGDTKQ
ncbi:MAG: transketolase [Verrucomicrobiota bacterium]